MSTDMVLSTSTAVDVVGPPSPMEWSALKEQAMMINASGLAPNKVDSYEKVLTIALKGRELQVPPMQALSHIHIIEGAPALSAELMRSLVRRAGHKIRIVEHSDERAVVTGVRADDPDYPLTVTWTPETAAKAGLVTIRDGKVQARSGGGKILPWESYTAALLLARASSALCRAMFDDVLMGASYTPEEKGVIDINPDTGEPIDLDPDAAYRDPAWNKALNRIEQLLADANDHGLDVDPEAVRTYADWSTEHAEAAVRNLETRISRAGDGGEQEDVPLTGPEVPPADDVIVDAEVVDNDPDPARQELDAMSDRVVAAEATGTPDGTGEQAAAEVAGAEPDPDPDTPAGRTMTVLDTIKRSLDADGIPHKAFTDWLGTESYERWGDVPKREQTKIARQVRNGDILDDIRRFADGT